MECNKCGSSMSCGAPHCETIKIQYECSTCGNIQTEKYTQEELKNIYNNED